MEQWAVVVPEWRSDAAAAVATVRPRSRAKVWIPLATAVLLGAVVAALLVVRHGRVDAAAADKPQGSQRPLSTSWTAHDPSAHGLFTIALPQDPRPTSLGHAPASDGSLSLSSTDMNGSRPGYLLLIRMGEQTTKSPEAALEQETSLADSKTYFKRLGPIRRTAVGGKQAFAADFEFQSGRRLREFRFLHDGVLYGAGVLYYPADTVSLDTALAALATLRWVS